MAAHDPPHDELLHIRPDIIAWWVSQGGQPMDENMIHRYLFESPFFDHTSKNGLIFNQAATNQQLWEQTVDRKRLEAAVVKNPGTEYMITGEPQDVQHNSVPKGTSSGVYNIRKQARERKEGRDTLVPLQTIYTCGPNMYQAPSVGDVLEARLLSATRHLSELIEAMAGVPTFSPATGYEYPTVASNREKDPKNREDVSRRGSISRDASVILTDQASSQDARQQRGTSLSSDAPPSSNTTSALDSRLLHASFDMSLAHAEDYTDENPLVGTPGKFKLESTAGVLRKRKAEEEAAAKTAAQEAERRRRRAASGTPGASRAASPAASPTDTPGREKEKGAASPTAATTDGKATTTGGKEKKMKAKRKKSKANFTGESPMTPGAAGNAGGSLPPGAPAEGGS